ncbi:MAG TPA: non-homologous end-joining DNA ligase [Aromatoleum sp.]|uniref:non-homologous end-joining DNA ligase n=1 Tax=Aromatoleum sp. TaxID=2307007 RepID=UPI002B49F852|nr:non-homologous end-joining DNA ligase [Aromatoleum sp.]HJV28183.1 non-homologous end-joining DNA ligase [Aromatoleum sp.]
MPRGVEAVPPSRGVRRAKEPAKGPPAAGTDPLGEYSAKRTFTATPEPAASALRAGGGPLLFVIQQHSARRLHFDFRLECDGVLKSWAVPKGPSLDPADKRLAVETEDHPYDYASFEGVIPPGQYGAGEVIVWDCGVYSPDEGQAYAFQDRDEAERRIREGLAKGKLSFTLCGEKVKGSFALVRSGEPRNWFLIKHKDRFAGATDLAARNRSVLSGLAVEELKQLPAHRVAAATLAPTGHPGSMPAKLSPMLAETGEAPFSNPDWLWEPKLDGYRVLAFVSGEGAEMRVKLLSRRGLDLTATFPRLAAELHGQAADMILDGELVAFDAAGRPSFNALQNRVQLKTERDIAAADRTTPVVFCCFDLLHFAGVDLRGAPYRDRRRYLSQCLLPSPLLQLVHVAEDGEALQSAALASGFEGVIGKRKDSRYEAGRRSRSWLKIKATQSGEFVVGGYTRGKGSRAPLGSLLIGYWDGKALRYASHVGSGFDATTLEQVRARLESLRTDVCPFAEKPELNGPTTWVGPEMVVEVQFQEWTEDGSLRVPIFLRVREDIDPKAVRRPDSRSVPHQVPHGGAAPSVEGGTGEIDEILQQLENGKTSFSLAVGAHQIRLTHLDRVYWPEDVALKQPAVTKRDLLRYFIQVSPYLLPHLADRPLTLIRMPDGIFGQRFFQKRWEQERPEFVETLDVYSEHKDERHEVLICNNLATLLWLAQFGTIELHVWHSRASPGADAAVQGTDYGSSAATLEASVLNYPDYVVFDLDPYIYSGKEAAGAEPELNTIAFEKGKEVAFWLRELLQSMALDAIVKTSGKTGLHIFVPIRRTLDFDAARKVCELVGRHLLRQHPRDITMEWSVRLRTGKIFLDYNMNVRGKTLNVAYSPRGVPGAPVSMPLTWDELASAHPLDFRITNVAQRLGQTGDRWHDALERKQSLEGALSGAKT